MFHEIQDMSVTDLMRLPARALLIPMHPDETCVSQENDSVYHVTLNGEWDFTYYTSYLDLIDGNTSAAVNGKITVPGMWELQGYGIPQYTNVRYPIPYDPPYIPDDTPCGVYSRNFSLPASFSGRHTRIYLEGVTSCAYVYVNEQLCGFTKGPHLPA